MSRTKWLLILRPFMWRITELKYLECRENVVCAKILSLRLHRSFPASFLDCMKDRVLFVDPDEDACKVWAEHSRERKALCVQEKFSWPQPVTSFNEKGGGTVYYAPNETYLDHILDKFQ